MKAVRIAIFLTGFLGLVLGGLATLSALNAGRDQSTIVRNETLKTEASQFVDQFHLMIKIAQNLADAPESNTKPIAPGFTHRGVVTLSQGAPSEIENLTSLQEAQSAADFALEERVL
jgi:hypothetical protein